MTHDLESAEGSPRSRPAHCYACSAPIEDTPGWWNGAVLREYCWRCEKSIARLETIQRRDPKLFEDLREKAELTYWRFQCVLCPPPRRAGRPPRAIVQRVADSGVASP